MKLGLFPRKVVPYLLLALAAVCPAAAQKPNPTATQTSNQDLPAGQASSPSTASTASPQTATQKLPVVQQRVEVTATKLPEEPENVPAAIEVFMGDELRARGVRDLGGALSLATGVSLAPGGDAGPASGVPEFWGLKEFDAFLLVVDGVPWGGAFNPALTSLNLSDVERIEVLRGPAPVTYGATSFVGVIHVVHESATSKARTLTLRGGSYRSGGLTLSQPVPLTGDWASRLTVEGDREGFSDDRTSYRRGHGSWRVERTRKDAGRIWFNTDLNWLDQDPASPRPREGTTLTPFSVAPLDANHNPEGAFWNDHRGTLMAGFDASAGRAQWYTTGSISHSQQDLYRGFLQEVAEVDDNAHGFREQIHLTDVYVDSHFAWKLPRSVTFLAGADYLHGSGNARGADFDYTIPLNGMATQVLRPDVLDVKIRDRRDFVGPYASVEWSPLERLRIDAGVRMNITREGRTDSDPAGTPEAVSQVRTETRPSASLGAVLTAWQRQQDSVRVFANYRDTFKPAAIDFGIGEHALGDLILQPETSRSVEGGVKAQFLGRRLEMEGSGFLMNFSNLVTATSVGGAPALINAGTQRFKGFEASAEVLVSSDIMARANYSWHDARFRNFVQDFDGTPTQLAGKRLEMSARNLAALGVTYVPARGFTGGVEVNYTGSRFLDRRNHAPTGGFATVGASGGYRTPRWEVRVDARNLGDRRDPVSESELGEAQYYLLPSRRVDATLRLHF